MVSVPVAHTTMERVQGGAGHTFQLWPLKDMGTQPPENYISSSGVMISWHESSENFYVSHTSASDFTVYSACLSKNRNNYPNSGMKYDIAGF